MILKFSVRSGVVWIEEENNEGFIIIILKYLKSCYVNNNDIINNIYFLLVFLGFRYVIYVLCNFYNNLKYYVLLLFLFYR